MIEIINLKKIYKSHKKTIVALNNINLTIGNSGMVFILGKSGCGKTTLLNMLGAIDNFDSGEIVVDGLKLSKMNKKERCAYRNSCVGFIFQEYNLIEDFNVEENIAIAQELQRQQSSGKISELLKKLEIPDLEKRRITELSGGQRQRVAIARALIKNPRIILADEPTGALDSESGENLMRLLKKISENRLVVVVSHDRDFAERFADKIIELKDGMVINDNAPTTIMNHTGALSPTYAKLKTGRAIGMGIRTAFKKPVRLITAVLLLSITVCLLGISCMISLFNGNMATKRTIFNTNRMYTIETARYVTGGTNILKNGTHDIRMLMDDGDLSKYTQLTGLPCIGLIQQYNSFENNVSNPPEKSMDEDNLSFNACTVLTEQSVRDFGFELAGNLPKTDNEMVITKYSLRSFINYGYSDGNSEFAINSAEDMIGKSITLWDRYSGNTLYNVCGVITNLDFDKSSFDEAIASTPEPNLKENLRKESDFYERYYPYRTMFVSSDRFAYYKNKQNFDLGIGLIKPTANLSSEEALYVQKNGRDISSLALLPFGEKNYYDGITKEVLFGDSLVNGQCILSLYELFAFIAENDISFDATDCVKTGCNSLNEYINTNFYNKEKIGQILEEDYAELINEWYTKEDRITEVYQALRNGLYDIYGDEITFAEKLYNDIADLVKKYACGLPVTIGGCSAMVKNFALGGIVFEKSNQFRSPNGILCLTEEDAYEISYGAVDNYYDYLLSEMPKSKNAMYVLYDDSFSSTLGMHFVMENFEKEAVNDFELQLTIAKELCTISCGVLGIFSVILLFNFIVASISLRKNDIRILNNLGAGNTEIYKIFFAESLLAVLFGVVFGIAMVGVAIRTFNAHYASFIHPALTALAFEWYVPFLLLGCALTIVTSVLSIAIRRVNLY